MVKLREFINIDNLKKKTNNVRLTKTTTNNQGFISLESLENSISKGYDYIERLEQNKTKYKQEIDRAEKHLNSYTEKYKAQVEEVSQLIAKHYERYLELIKKTNWHEETAEAKKQRKLLSNLREKYEDIWLEVISKYMNLQEGKIIYKKGTKKDTRDILY